MSDSADMHHSETRQVIEPTGAGATSTEPRTWHMGDSEPADLPRIVDAYGDTWWREQGRHDGWRSAHLGFSEPSKTWWRLTAYRSPLREESK